MKALVAYFSAESGRTANAAKSLAAAIGADLFEIKPEKPYTSSDLNYMNPLARCNREHITKKQVPVSGKVENFAEYDTVLIGFPIWYGCAPNVVNTFCKEYDFTGKKVAAFATSGGSGIGKTAEKLKPYVSGADVIDAKLMNAVDKDTLKRWVDGL
jgi:flavodoxin